MRAIVAFVVGIVTSIVLIGYLGSRYNGELFMGDDEFDMRMKSILY